ncbi:hypothetical protein KR093_004906, partial [Drosophila rubida]
FSNRRDIFKVNMVKNQTSLDDEFEYFLRNVRCCNQLTNVLPLSETSFRQASCISVLYLPYDNRCMMLQRVHNCHDIIGYFNYFEIMYCFFHVHDKITELCVSFLCLAIAIIFLLLMSIVVDSYFLPVLKILSVRLRMNESVAGATLLVFGASCPNLVANMLPIRQGSAMFASTIADSVVTVLLCGGLICYMKPFKMDGFVVVRDLLFFWLAVELLRYLMFYNMHMSRTDSLILLSVYALYLVIILADLWLMRRSIRKLQNEITAMEKQSITEERNRKLRSKIMALKNLLQNDHISIRHSTLQPRDPDLQQPLGIHLALSTLNQAKAESVDYNATRTILHSKSNSKNSRLWSDFLESLNPIDATNWRLAGRCERIYIMLKCPMRLLVTILVPVVDYELYKHGWSKLLNCTQIVTNPFFVITAVHMKVQNRYSSWYTDTNVRYSKWSLCLTVPLAIIAFFHTRTDLPPPYHFLFIVLTTSSSLVIIVICTSEIDVLLLIVGIVCNMSEHFVNITFGCIGNALVNLLASYSMTIQGYEKMAFTAVFASPFFNTVVTMGIVFLHNKKVLEPGSASWLNGEHGDNCYIFISITIVTTLWWLLILNFNTRRSAAIFSWSIFLVFLLYAAAVEWDLVHEMGKDEYYPPI